MTTDIIDNVTSIGPHPATRTELEARAEGHTPTPWCVDYPKIHYYGKLKPYGISPCNEDDMPLLSGSGGARSYLDHIVKCQGADLDDANMAFIVLAVNSYAPMKEALEAVLSDLEIGAHPYLHIEQIRAALSAARGNTRKE